MNTLDFLVVIMAISALVRGFEIGLVRQLFSTAGFIGGLFLGAFLEHFTIHLAHTPSSRTVTAILTTLGCAFVFLTVGEAIGGRLKSRIEPKLHFNRFDGVLGSGLGTATLLVAVWLAASILLSLPLSSAQSEIRSSAIMSALNRTLPPAPDIIGTIGKLIDPNGFPQVFTGSEPDQPENTTIPGISPQLQQAIDTAKVSVVKMESLGCGGIVDGSGFVVGPDLVATNAHVIAGVRRPYAKDNNGQHSATPVWFDSDLDFALLRVPNLAGAPLLLQNSTSARRTSGAVIGYPGGGALTAGGASVLDTFTASGRDIYGKGVTRRDVYSLAAKVIPGNSGGPVINAEGSVIGVVFAQSTVYDTVGYALTTPQLQQAVSQAQAQNRAVSTGSCAD